MNRLTEKGFNFDAYFVASNLQSWPIAEALKRLQAFEDLFFDASGNERISFDLLREICSAEEDGRVVILPKTKAPNPPYHLPVPPRISSEAETAQTGKVEKMAELRPCNVNGKNAMFHRWADKAQVISPGMTVGSHPGGQLWSVVGIVEYADGTVAECYPYEIKFLYREAPNE